MARRIIWSSEALADLADIYHYIKLDNQTAAKNVADKLRNLAKTLVDQPGLGLKCPEHSREDIRQLFHRKYRLIYQIASEEEVRILQIFTPIVMKSRISRSTEILSRRRPVRSSETQHTKSMSRRLISGSVEKAS